MTQVTMHDETPSQAIVKAASATASVTDARGRTIAIRKLGPLDRMKLFEVVGPENSRNEQYVGYAALAFIVSAIDGEPVARPNTKLALEALVQRLDEDGMDAVARHLAEQANEQGPIDEAALKNG